MFGVVGEFSGEYKRIYEIQEIKPTVFRGAHICN